MIARSHTNGLYDYPIPAVNQTYTRNGLNQYPAISGTNGGSPLYDLNGNLKSDGKTTPTNDVYDAENRLVSASGATSATFTYDPLGRLFQGTTTGSTRFLYDGDRLIVEYDGAGVLKRRYVHGAGVDEPLVWYEGSGVSATARRYLHADHQGSIVATANASGAKLEIGTYDAYGVSTAPTSWRFQYTGQTFISSIGLYYYKARFYNPSLGRFMQTDPIGYDDDVNLYAYVGNDPPNRTDPLGLFGRGEGFNDEEWEQFDEAQQQAANSMEHRAERMEARAEKLDSKEKPGGDALRAQAGRLREAASALRSDGSDGRVANAVDADTFQNMGASKNAAAFVNGAGGNVMTVNKSHSVWSAEGTVSQWVVGHEALHTAGLIDQSGSNGVKAYKYGTDLNKAAFKELQGTGKSLFNPDHLMDLVY